jgi:hypothetical protein
MRSDSKLGCTAGVTRSHDAVDSPQHPPEIPSWSAPSIRPVSGTLGRDADEADACADDAYDSALSVDERAATLRIER